MSFHWPGSADDGCSNPARLETVQRTGMLNNIERGCGSIA
ncbi:hypothetical protein JOD20_005308 [Herpetosiphon giganteus]|nr:hypothetical protein [Herpetosiphon giganteus]